MHSSLLATGASSALRRGLSQPPSEYRSRLYDEIAILMRAFGDCCDVHMQIRESVVLVERILIQQLRAIIELALEASDNRAPQLNDFEFLLHRNKPKLARFRRHMRTLRRVQGKDVLQRLSSDDDENEEDDEPEVYDAEKTRRIYRADRISQILSPQKYEEFQRARSFTSNMRNKMSFLGKLVDVLQVPKEVQDEPHFLDVILFFAQETVATLIDFAILTRLTSENRLAEPVIVPSNLSNDILQLCPEVTQGRGQEGIKPIRVQEIQEAMRRVQQMHNYRRMGSSKVAFLAL